MALEEQTGQVTFFRLTSTWCVCPLMWNGLKVFHWLLRDIASVGTGSNVG